MVSDLLEKWRECGGGRGVVIRADMRSAARGVPWVVRLATKGPKTKGLGGGEDERICRASSGKKESLR